jgi:hypothetical protein
MKELIRHILREHTREIGEVKKTTTPEFIEKAKRVHGDKYDYSETEYTLGKNKVNLGKKKSDKQIIYISDKDFGQSEVKHKNKSNLFIKMMNKKFDKQLFDHTSSESDNDKKEIKDKYRKN